MLRYISQIYIFNEFKFKWAPQNSINLKKIIPAKKSEKYSITIKKYLNPRNPSSK